MTARTLFDKLWDAHVVVPETEDTPAVLYVDLHLLHEVTSPQAFAELAERGLEVRRPDRCLATMDHSTPTLAANADGELPYVDEQARRQVETLRANCARHGIELFGLDSDNRGIVHVIGPEIGATQPGMVIVCGDSHTSSHGALGALAFGIGTTEVGHVLATQCLLQRKPKSMAIEVTGQLGSGVTAKDLALHIIGRIGVDGGTGHVIEYRGDAVRGLSVEGRLTLCNMSIEAGARAGMVAPDDTTFEYLRGLPKAPADLDGAIDRWRELRTDDGARFDRNVTIDATAIHPTVTYGTNPAMVAPVAARVPEPKDSSEAKALEYMDLGAGDALLDRSIDVVFIGSCTNARIEDLRAAATVFAGRKVAPGVRTLVVPGSQRVKEHAEREGLDRIFVAAGCEWREPGCSMCIAMNGDRVEPGEYAVSTSNRNFAGRQGPGARTFLASPLTAAASAVRGKLTDPRELA